MGTLLAATWLSAVPALMPTLVTAACPACGDYGFYAGFKAVAGSKSWRYVNDGDVVASFLDTINYQVDVGIQLFSYDILPTPGCEHSLETCIYLLSPSGTPGTSSCCLFDDAAQARMRAVFDQRLRGRRAAP